jgi:hypothetical protein
MSKANENLAGHIMIDSPDSLSTRPTKQIALHGGTCFSVVVLWIVTFVLAFTPNNKLHELGFGNAVATDMTVGIFFAFPVAVFSFAKRRTSQSIVLVSATQLLAWGHSLGLIVFFAFAAVYALRHGA